LGLHVYLASLTLSFEIIFYNICQGSHVVGQLSLCVRYCKSEDNNFRIARRYSIDIDILTNLSRQVFIRET